jgi:SSS family solute:Na+ symporter
LLAALTVGSYVFINFALVFYTGGFALEKIWGIDRLAAVWILAAVTGIYTVYGGLRAMAWTSSLQCVLLLGSGLCLFFIGMSRIDWNFAAMLGSGQRAHLMTPADHEVPWTALLMLMLSTNVWYYVSNQYINQRCLAARDEWHAKMGVLFAVALQLLMPLATCFPGMIYRVINPDLANPDATYPMVVSEFVPAGLRGLVLAGVLSAIMSTVSGLVNSTSTLVTLDLVRPTIGRNWDEVKLVKIGRWSGALALLIGALFAPVVMRWENIFRYAQDLWAPMAAPVVVIFLAGALWPGAKERGAVACLWLSILSIPFILAKSVLADFGVDIVPQVLQNPMVLAAVVGEIALILMVALSIERLPVTGWIAAGSALAAVLLVGIASAPAAVVLWVLASIALTLPLLVKRKLPMPNLWDWSMAGDNMDRPWYARLSLWWGLFAAILVCIYIRFW